MTVDDSTLSRLISMTAMDGVQNQSSPLAAATSDNSFSDLLSMLMLMMQQSPEQNGGALNGDASAATSSSSVDIGNSVNSDGTLWQQMESVAPLNLTAGTNGTSSADSEATAALTNDFSAKTADYSGIIDKMAQKYSVDPRLIESVISAESGGNASAVSSSGALGLMQLMPETASSLGVSNALDPAQNIEGGTKYLSNLINRYHGNIPLVLAAYNAGSGNVTKYGGIPPFPETQSYVRRVMGNMEEYSV
ncbi:lytic transglycosylase domain-containing protein [Sporolactobacillus pectinivorans]|uniref:lytic transglycosylase domain-containing protein n=1 Tax=Sporolactobacillus pectinivorans TaxID=1591408 RepID=UPI000C25BC5D|nr:lytic transglycosylase domain-containing protein [Sporolactobacillus pectinivorans]